jgi:putative transposase
MTAARAGQLQVGDFVRFGGELYEIAGVDGVAVVLVAEPGRRMVVKASVLLADSTFEIVDSRRRRRPLPPAYFDSLSVEHREKALWLQDHISEVLDGVPAGSPPETPARPGYDVTCTTLRQRELAKVAELADTDRPIGLRVLQRYRRGYALVGIEALIDKRAVRRTTLSGRVDDRYVEVLRNVLRDNVDASTGTSARLKRRVDTAVEASYGPGVVAIPSRQTFDRLRRRLAAARHATGSARTRRSLANQPDGPFSTVTATRPGEWMQIDSTPFDVAVRLDQDVTGRVELTALVDVRTRSIAAAVLRPTTKAVDASLLLAKSMTPEPMRPGWPQAISMAYSALPYQVLRSIDERLDNAAARPVIVPENIVCDNGKAYLSQTFLNACRVFGISLQPAHPFTPTDKPIVERTLESVKTLFAQYVTGFVGSSTEHRGRNADQHAVFSLIELQDLLDEWIVTGWQNRPHDGLRDPLTPNRVLTPNEMYAASVSVAGYIPVPLSSDDYIGLHPSQPRAINSYGVKIDHRVYDSDELNPYRGERSGVTELGDRWAVHYDPYDVTRVWIRNHHDGGFITAYWRQLHCTPEPFGDAAWQYARRVVTDRDTRGATEETITAAVEDLLDRAAPPPGAKRRRKPAHARRTAARTRAANTTRTTIEAPPHPSAPDGSLEPESDESIADVIPLPVFDPDKEAQSW